MDGMVTLIVSEKYETLKNLYEYSVEDVLDLFEIALVSRINTRILADNNRTM